MASLMDCSKKNAEKSQDITKSPFRGRESSRCF
jgi:hypothetical protein